MFKKRNLKNSNASRRREEPDTINEDLETSSFSKEPLSKRPKIESAASRDIDYTKTKTVNRDLPNESAPATSEISTEDTSVAEPKPKIVGPKAAPKNVRVTTLTDFQPDVCKDFKQTGYCGYGDTCKFLHIRDESRQKKPIEKEWQTVKTGAEKPDSKQSEDVPFKCLICRNDYKNPVKTACGHIFCQACFMNRYKKEKKRKCYVCKEDTGGAVQPVKDVFEGSEKKAIEQK